MTESLIVHRPHSSSTVDMVSVNTSHKMTKPRDTGLDKQSGRGERGNRTAYERLHMASAFTYECRMKTLAVCVAAASVLGTAFFTLQHLSSADVNAYDALRVSRRLSQDETSDEHIQKIISAHMNLISIEFTEGHTVKNDFYSGIIGVFCELDFEKQKKDPNKFPMFRDLVDASGCHGDKLVQVDLGRVVDLAKDYDTKLFEDSINSGSDASTKGPHVLSLKGAVFHESRCGSTLAANALVALNPERNRVYSESAPPKLVLKKCGEDFTECSVQGAANLMRDVVYLMGRSDNSLEENLFFKFQSTTTRTMQVFRTAFPSTPWVFLYREPIEVMQSHLDMPNTSTSNCVRNYKKSPMIKLLARKLRLKMKDLENEEVCALHLATICGSALINLEEANGLGMALNYDKEMAQELLDYVFPKHFHTPVHQDGYRRVMEVSKLYSKSYNGEDEIFVSDKEEKRAKASSSVKDSAVEFLEPSYKKLEKTQFNINKICNQVNLDSRISSVYCRALSRMG